jgi:hypothetical protein
LVSGLDRRHFVAQLAEYPVVNFSNRHLAYQYFGYSPGDRRSFLAVD